MANRAADETGYAASPSIWRHITDIRGMDTIACEMVDARSTRSVSHTLASRNRERQTRKTAKAATTSTGTEHHIIHATTPGSGANTTSYETHSKSADLDIGAAEERQRVAVF